MEVQHTSTGMGGYGMVLGIILLFCVACERPAYVITHDGEEVVAADPETPEGPEVVRIPMADRVLETFVGEVGVRQEGSNTGERIEEYLATTGLDGGYPWCAAFVSWGLTVNDIENPQSAWSPAWFPDSNVIYYRDGDRREDPGPADIIGIWFNNLGRIAHVGVVEEWGSSYIITIEGNTNDSGSREGDGVYRKRRMERQIYAVSRWVDDCIFYEYR